MGYYRLEKRKKNKCDYRRLTKKEEEVLDPHSIKPKRGGSKNDLSVCRPSGKVVEHRKIRHYDDDGNLVYPGGTHYEPVCININESPWKELLEQMTTKYKRTTTYIEFRVIEFDPPPEAVLSKLGIDFFNSTWKKGEKRRPDVTITHAENGFSIAADRRYKTVEQQVDKLLERVYPFRQQIKTVCGNCYAELSCAIYVVGDEVPDLHLSKEVNKRLADMNAEIDIDLYFFPRNDEPRPGRQPKYRSIDDP